MQHKRPPLPLIVVVVLIIAAGAYYGVRALNNTEDNQLKASGTIESTVVNVSPEMAGKVAKVLVDEGQPVKKGDPLLVLDDSVLNAQRAVAQSGVASAENALLAAQNAYNLAQAQYDVTLTSARGQEGAARLSDWVGRANSRFDQPLWYFSQEEQITAAQAEVDATQKALEQAQTDLDQTTNDLHNADFINAEARVAQARVSYSNAKTVRNLASTTGGKVHPEDIEIHVPAAAPSYGIKIHLAKLLSSNTGDVIASAQDALDAAETELIDAQQAYDALLNTDAADRVQKARAAVSVARQRHEVAMDTLNKLQTGQYSPQVKIASVSLEQAKTGLQQAQNAVNQAKANLDLLDTQIKKLTVYVPMDGVILTRNVEPGEFVQPGAVAFSMADLNNITITVYVPEDRYGQISMGQKADVTVDSFPEQTFNAEVIHIADQAEFTPRNVQTVEGRSSTVYAIKLKVTDPEGKLKIGMPADVVFKQGSAAE